MRRQRETPQESGAEDEPAARSTEVTASGEAVIAARLLQRRRALLQRRMRRLSARIVALLAGYFDADSLDRLSETQLRGVRLWYDLGRRLAGLLGQAFPSWLGASSTAAGASVLVAPGFQLHTLYEGAQAPGALVQQSVFTTRAATGASASEAGSRSGPEAAAPEAATLLGTDPSETHTAWTAATADSQRASRAGTDAVVVARATQTDTPVAAPDRTGLVDPVPDTDAREWEYPAVERGRRPEWLVELHRTQARTVATQTEDVGVFASIWTNVAMDRNWESAQLQLPSAYDPQWAVRPASQRVDALATTPLWAYASYRVEQDPGSSAPLIPRTGAPAALQTVLVSLDQTRQAGNRTQQEQASPLNNLMANAAPVLVTQTLAA